METAFYVWSAIGDLDYRQLRELSDRRAIRSSSMRIVLLPGNQHLEEVATGSATGK
ncbi:MAG: hypothetical protein HKL83_05860 [Acidimicrobiaceae bacterium]|nr:hypothetical protein [Acidimicrobiaceae bacterium]